MPALDVNFTPPQTALCLPFFHHVQILVCTRWTAELLRHRPSPHLDERGGVSEGEAATETGSGGQLVRTGVQTVCSHRTDLCTWLPTRDWWVKPLSPPCLPVFVPPPTPVCLSLLPPLCPLLPRLPLFLSQTAQRCVSPLIPLLCLGWSAAAVHTRTHTKKKERKKDRKKTHTYTQPGATRQTALSAGGWWESNYAWRDAQTEGQVVWGESWYFFLSTQSRKIHLWLAHGKKNIHQFVCYHNYSAVWSTTIGFIVILFYKKMSKFSDFCFLKGAICKKIGHQLKSHTVKCSSGH